MSSQPESLRPLTDPVWMQLISGQKNVDLKFLAAKILLTSQKLKYSLHPSDDQLKKSAEQFRDLYLKRGHLPDAKRDIAQYFRREK